MANEIDLFKDLAFCEKVLARKDIDDESRREWLNEKNRVELEIKTTYPDLVFGE